MSIDLLAIDSEFKTCTKCSVRSPVDNFRLKSGYRENVCKKCRNSAANRKTAWKDMPSVDAKHAFVTAAKLSAGCYHCGYKEHPAALQYDHIDPSTKKKSIASCMGSAWTVLINEMAKCRVLCANCHNIHHYGFRYE